MDLTTIIGIVAAFGLVLVAIGGGLSAFINAPSLMIVVGGTLGAAMINYPAREIMSVFAVASKAFFGKKPSEAKVIEQFVEFASKARREGILALEADLENVDDEFLKRGLQLAIDGMEPATIREIMETEVALVQTRHRLGAEIFTTLGTYAPALGMVGTLIGLVQMLQSMSDPSTIGPAMAVALLTTFYGALLANVLCIPLAGKLRTKSSQEVLFREMIVEGIIALSNGENPRIMEQKLVAFLAPKLRPKPSE